MDESATAYRPLGGRGVAAGNDDGDDDDPELARAVASLERSVGAAAGGAANAGAVAVPIASSSATAKPPSPSSALAVGSLNTDHSAALVRVAKPDAYVEDDGNDGGGIRVKLPSGSVNGAGSGEKQRSGGGGGGGGRRGADALDSLKSHASHASLASRASRRSLKSLGSRKSGHHPPQPWPRWVRIALWTYFVVAGTVWLLLVAAALIRAAAQHNLHGIVTLLETNGFNRTTTDGFATYTMNVGAADSARYDLHDVEKTLLGTLFVRLCNRDIALMRQILCGANVVVANDLAAYYKLFASLQDAYRRISSHHSIVPQYGVPEGHVLKTLLTGERAAITPVPATDDSGSGSGSGASSRLGVGVGVGVGVGGAVRGSVAAPRVGDTWFQFEGAEWNPYHNPSDSFVHLLNYFQYKLTGRNVGPLGSSPHTDHNPIVIPYSGPAPGPRPPNPTPIPTPPTGLHGLRGLRSGGGGGGGGGSRSGHNDAAAAPAAIETDASAATTDPPALHHRRLKQHTSRRRRSGAISGGGGGGGGSGSGSDAVGRPTNKSLHKSRVVGFLQPRPRPAATN